jgi:hypothetical protein
MNSLAPALRYPKLLPVVSLFSVSMFELLICGYTNAEDQQPVLTTEKAGVLSAFSRSILQWLIKCKEMTAKAICHEEWYFPETDRQSGVVGF